jgi:hypothetical protein
MSVLNLLRVAIQNPDVRKFAGRMVASAASECAAPGCKARSPGTSCGVCDAPMCLTHSSFRMSPPGPICTLCLVELWNENLPVHAEEEFRTRRPTGTPRTTKRKRK